jgi:hypothetical protein
LSAAAIVSLRVAEGSSSFRHSGATAEIRRGPGIDELTVAFLCAPLAPLKERAIEQSQTVRLAGFGVVFFLAAAVILDLVFVAATPDYWFRQHLSSGISLLVLDAANVVALYFSWRRRTWGYVIAILLALFIAGATVVAVFFGGDTIGGPSQVVYTITMIMIRLLIVFFAGSAALLKRDSRSQSLR